MTAKPTAPDIEEKNPSFSQESEELRNFIQNYTPGQFVCDPKIVSKVKSNVPYLKIGFLGPKGAGKSALINTIISSFKDSEPFVLAPTQSKGAHGTVALNEYPVTPYVRLADVRGFDFVDDEAEQFEVRAIMSGKLKPGNEIVRRTDKKYNGFTPLKNVISRLIPTESKIHMILLLISLSDFNDETPKNLEEIVALIKEKYDIKPLVVLSHKDECTEDTVKQTRMKISEKLKFDVSHIVAVESYHFDEQDDPLEDTPRVLELEKRALKLLKRAIQIGDDQLKLLSNH